MTKSELIKQKNEQIETLKKEIRNICFEYVKEEKDLVVGDMVEIPSKGKFAFFSELHTEDINDMIIKSYVLTKAGIPAKKITTFNLGDIVKVKDSIDSIVKNNFSGEDFNADKAIEACIETQQSLRG
jgi:nucleoid DNA-binding protein